MFIGKQKKYKSNDYAEQRHFVKFISYLSCCNNYFLSVQQNFRSVHFFVHVSRAGVQGLSSYPQQHHVENPTLSQPIRHFVGFIIPIVFMSPIIPSLPIKPRNDNIRNYIIHLKMYKRKYMRGTYIDGKQTLPESLCKISS